MKNLWISAVLSGVLIGLAVIAATALLVSVGLSFYSDPLKLLSACALIANFAGGFAAAATAALKIKEKPMPSGISAGLVLCLILALVALVSGSVASALLPLGLVLGGSFVGSLAAPAMTTKRKSKYSRLVKND